jgi:hypothetical protein
MGGNGATFLVIFFVFIRWNRENLLFGWNGGVSAGRGGGLAVEGRRLCWEGVDVCSGMGETGEIFGILFSVFIKWKGGNLVFRWKGGNLLFLFGLLSRET